MSLRDRFPDLVKEPRAWLVTGAAGFIGSNLVEALLRMGQRVRGLDNFSTGFRHNLEQVREAVGPGAWARFDFIEGDIRKVEDCHRACAGMDYVLHQAALGSVPRSIDDPITSHDSNVTGFLHMLVAARDAGVKRFVYAASSAAYGDWPGLALPTQLKEDWMMAQEVSPPMEPPGPTRTTAPSQVSLTGRPSWRTVRLKSPEPPLNPETRIL